MPKNANDVSRSIITLSHADGWALGRNFFFMDTLISEQGEPSQVNLYGEFYSYLSLSKMTGKTLSYGLFKDLNLAAGVNAAKLWTAIVAAPASYYMVSMSILTCRVSSCLASIFCAMIF